MKHALLILVACLGTLLSVPVLHAEELEDFLKRSGVGDTTKEDFHENFYALVYVEGKPVVFSRDQLLQFQKEQKAAGVKPTFEKLTIVSKIETPANDGKDTIISVVSTGTVSLKNGLTTTTGQTTNHDVLLRNANGKFLILFSSAKQEVQ